MRRLLREHRRTIGGVPTRGVCADGEAGRVRFLFLHGFSDSADCWQRVQRRLADAGHGSMAVDQPSHGFADALAPDLPAVEQFVALPGVGHMPQVEVPGRTTKHLLAFAARVGSPTREAVAA